MTPKDKVARAEKLIENYVRSKVKKMLKEDNQENEALVRAIKTIDRISYMMRGLQRDLYMLTKNPDYKVTAEKITKIIDPLGKMTDQILNKLDDLDPDPPGYGMT